METRTQSRGARVALVVALVVGSAGLAGQAEGQERGRERGERECVCSGGDLSFENMPGVGLFNFGRARARLGVELRADAGDEGALVTRVNEGSPAEEAGIEEGDVIVAIDGQSLVRSPEDAPARGLMRRGASPADRLMALARDWDPGDQVEVTLLRGDDRRTVTVEVEEVDDAELGAYFDLGRARELSERLGTLREDRWLPPTVELRRGPPGIFRFGVGDGMELREVDAALGRYFGTETGALVLSLDEESPLGLEVGDVILMIGDRLIDEPSDVWRVLASYDSDELIPIEVMRDQSRITVEGTRRD